MHGAGIAGRASCGGRSGSRDGASTGAAGNHRKARGTMEPRKRAKSPQALARSWIEHLAVQRGSANVRGGADRWNSPVHLRKDSLGLAKGKCKPQIRRPVYHEGVRALLQSRTAPHAGAGAKGNRRLCETCPLPARRRPAARSPGRAKAPAAARGRCRQRRTPSGTAPTARPGSLRTDRCRSC